MGRDSIQIEDLLDALNGNIVATYDRTKSRKFIRFMMKVSQLPLEFRIYYKHMTRIIPVETIIDQIKRIIELEDSFRFKGSGISLEGRKMYNRIREKIKAEYHENCYKDLLNP